MKTELLYLLLTAVLTGVLWIPVVIGDVKSRGPLTLETYKTPPTAKLPDWVNRANRAHVNAVENFGPFAAVVLIGQLIGVSTPVTAACAVLRSPCACSGPHQRLRKILGEDGALYHRVACVHHLCGGAADAGDVRRLIRLLWSFGKGATGCQAALGGRKAKKSLRTASYPAATCSRKASALCRAISCSPIGQPCTGWKPAGTLMAGSPASLA
jgi:hypothetical protein